MKPMTYRKLYRWFIRIVVVVLLALSIWSMPKAKVVWGAYAGSRWLMTAGVCRGNFFVDKGSMKGAIFGPELFFSSVPISDVQPHWRGSMWYPKISESKVPVDPTGFMTHSAISIPIWLMGAILMMIALLVLKVTERRQKRALGNLPSDEEMN